MIRHICMFKLKEENKEKMERSFAEGDFQSSRFYACKIIALDFVKESMKEIGI